MRPIISFDIDGVIAEGSMISWEQQRDTPEVYETLELNDVNIPDVLYEMHKHVDIYLVSARSFPNCLEVTRRWLDRNGIRCHWFGGVILRQAFIKDQTVRYIGSQLHFDDDPAVVKPLMSQGVLYVNPNWPDNQQYFTRFGGCTHWRTCVSDYPRQCGDISVEGIVDSILFGGYKNANVSF